MPPAAGVTVSPMPMSRCRRLLHRVKLAVVVAAVGVLAAACGTTASAAAKNPPASSELTNEMTEYVGGHWIPFTSAMALSPAQWAVVDTYANFSSAALAVYSTRSVAPLATVVSAQSGVTNMFARDLAAGKNPEAIYTKATVEAVAIHGCRASLTLELYYPGGRSLHYVSSWVRPFDRAALPHASQHGGASTSSHAGNLASLAATQYAPWQFVGDNRVGGVDTPCGI